jgi:hypothetical protein
MISCCRWRNTSVRRTRSSARARSLEMSRVMGAAPYRTPFRVEPVLQITPVLTASRRP